MVFILSCGDNKYCQGCQNEGDVDQFTPITKLPSVLGGSLEKVKKVACGREHTMMLLKDGRLFGIGHNQHGQIYGTQDTFKEFTEVQTLFLQNGDRIVDLYCTQINTYLITEMGHVFWSGWENRSPEKDYLLVNAPSSLKHIDLFHTNSNGVHCFLKSGNKLFACGWNSNGQLGTGTRNDSYGDFVEVSFDTKSIKDITVGAQFSVLVTHDSSLFGCGISVDSANNDLFTRIVTPFTVGIRGVVCGGFRSFIQLENNELYTCSNISSSFEKLELDEPLTAWAAGWQFFVAMSITGKLYAHGSNSNGQLGYSTHEEDVQLKCVEKGYHLGRTWNRHMKLDCGEFYTLAFLLCDEMSRHFLFIKHLVKLATGEDNDNKSFLSDITINTHNTMSQ